MIVPSRQRPQAVAEMHQAVVEAGTTIGTVMFVVDDDDSTWLDYAASVEKIGDQRILAVRLGPVDERIPGMVQSLNVAAEYQAGIGSVFAIGFMGDDHRPRASAVPWDHAYVAQLKQLGSGMVYGNDLFQGPNIPTQIAMTSDIIRALGYMVWPRFHHLYVDNMWLALGEATGCIRYMPDVIVEHMHPAAGKSEMDEGYARVNAGEVATHDHGVFQQYLTEQLAGDAEKIRAMRSAVEPESGDRAAPIECECDDLDVDDDTMSCNSYAAGGPCDSSTEK